MDIKIFTAFVIVLVVISQRRFGILADITDFQTYKASMGSCILRSEDSNAALGVDDLIKNGARIIHVGFNFNNFTRRLKGYDQSSVYDPKSWTIAIGRQGRNLLLLRPQYQMLSLTYLSLETHNLIISLDQEPPHCLSVTNVTLVSLYLRQFLLYKFTTTFLETNSTERTNAIQDGHICNLHIKGDSDNNAIFRYECCSKNSERPKCQQLEADFYVDVLLYSIYVVTFFAIMFSPLLIPSRLYKKKYQTTVYEYNLSEPITLSIRKSSNTQKKENVFPISYFSEMPEFKKQVQLFRSDATYDIILKKIDIVTEVDRLLRSNRVPVGLFESLYAAVIKCEIRKKSSMRDCCKSNILGPWKPCNHSIAWIKLLKPLANLVLYILFGQIWVLRLVFFYEYEKLDRELKEKAAHSRNLTLPYTGNLTWYLTPVHISFLICYCIFLVDLALFGVLFKQVKRTLKRVMRKCLGDMRELSKTSAVGWTVQLLLHPFKHCGIMGILFAWAYYIPAVPIVVATLAFYSFPTVNILVRLIIYFMAYLLKYVESCIEVQCGCLKRLKDYIYRVFRMDILSENEMIEIPEWISVGNKFLELLIIFLCFLSILSFVFLAMECIVFVVEILMYTLIGIIINASNILKYVTLFFLILFYARDSFNTVNTEYLTFNKFLNRFLVNSMRETVENVSDLDQEIQRNTAFKVSMDGVSDGNDDHVALLIKNDKLYWKTNSLILFLDRNDTPYITRKFFFDTCYLEVAGVPGPLLSSLLRAMGRFLIICVFLIFVVIVILAFGEEYGISATNQMFATLAGGFLPYILRFVLFKPPEPVTVDPDNLSFKSQLRSKIENYKQTWEIADICVKSFKSRQKDKVTETASVIEEEKRNQGNITVVESGEVITMEVLPNSHQKLDDVDILISDNALV